MNILFDQGTPVPLRRFLIGHTVNTLVEQGWSTLTNGQLLDAAEQSGYQVFMTTDQNLRYQQNLTNRQLAIVVLGSTSWPRIQAQTATILSVIENSRAGGYYEIAIP
jgi:hypothetical protein